MIKCRSPFDGRAKVSRSSISDMSSVLSKRRQSLLREFRWTRGVCLDVCRNAARAAKNFLAFAGMLQVPRKTFWALQGRCKCFEKFFGVCRNAASASKNFLAFAGTLQVPRKTFWSLQECCKCFEKLFGVCRDAASPTKNFLAFATPLQVSRKTFWRLQHRCKSHEKLSGVCNTVASISKNVWAIRGFRRNSLLGCRTHVIDRLVRQEYPTGGKGLSRLIMLSVGPMENFSTCGFGTVSLGLTPIASPVGRMELFLLLRPDLQNRKTVR